MIGGQSQHDILLYLDEQLLNIDWDEDTRHLVISTLSGRADGMYAFHFLHPHIRPILDIGSDG